MDIPPLLVAFAVVFIVYFLFVKKGKNNDPNLPPLATGSLPLVGHMYSMFRKGAKNFFLDNHRKYGGIYRMMLGPNETYIISDRKYFTQYYNTIEEKLSFQTPIKNLLLISSIWTDSAHSDKITNIVQPEAVRKMMQSENYTDLIIATTQQLMNDPKYFPNDKGTINFATFSSSVLVRVFSILMLGLYIGDEIYAKLREFEAVVLKNITIVAAAGQNVAKRLPLWKKVLQQRDEVTRDLVLKVQEAKKKGNRSIFLEYLLVNNCSDEQIAMVINSTFFAGFSVTTSLVANALFLAATFPNFLGDLRSNSFDSPFYTGWTLETARVSFGFLTSFRAVEQSPLKIGNYTIPVGAAVAIDGKSPSLESEEFNKSPYSYDKFDPSRFVNNQYSEYGIMPWGHGIHQCPGKPVAVMSAKGIVHTLLQHFSFTKLTPDFTIEYQKIIK